MGRNWFCSITFVSEITMDSKKRAPRDASARPRAEDVRQQHVSRMVDASKQRTTDAAAENREAQQFFNRVSKDKDASVRFLRKAGILDSSGKLAKPYRD
jgi:hypothetical protein